MKIKWNTVFLSLACGSIIVFIKNELHSKEIEKQNQQNSILLEDIIKDMNSKDGSSSDTDENINLENSSTVVESIQLKTISNEELGELIVKGETVKLTSLLENGMDPNRECDSNDSNCVLYAALVGNVEILKILLDYGGNPNVKGDYISPLYAAIQGRNLPCVEILLEYGADPNLKFGEDGDIITPLSIASYLGFNEIAEVLVEAGATY